MNRWALSPPLGCGLALPRSLPGWRPETQGLGAPMCAQCPRPRAQVSCPCPPRKGVRHRPKGQNRPGTES